MRGRPALGVLMVGSLVAFSRRSIVQSSPRAMASPLVFTGATVIDVREGRRQPGQTVVVVGNRIDALGPAAKVRIPPGARVVNAKGKYLIPGLWDMHVHPQGFVDIAYPLFVANGVTSVRDAGSSVPLVVLGRWKQEIAAGDRVGPRLIVSGQSIDQTNDGKCLEYSYHICVATPEEARLLVDFFKTAGADMIKTYGLKRELHLAVAAEARRVGIPFGGHSWNVPGLEISDSGATILDHSAWLNPEVCGAGHDPGILDSVSDERCAAAGQHLRHNGTWVLYNAPAGGGAALNAFRSQQLERWRRFLPAAWFEKLRSVFDSHAGEKVLPPLPPPTSTASWTAAVVRADSNSRPDTAEMKERRASTRMLASLPILAGPDVGLDSVQLFGDILVSGFSLHEVLVLYVVNGMSPLAALQTATLNPALALHMTDSLGTVEAGKVADLVLLDEDPLADIWNTTKISAVVANGRYFDHAALDGLLNAAEQAAHR